MSRAHSSEAIEVGRPEVLLTVAGFDPSAGAGLTADVKVFAAHRFYAVAAATALTVQATRGIGRVEPVAAGLLAATLAELAEDLPVAGIKIGMLATAENVEAVADFLEDMERASGARIPAVLDPVLASSSGHALLSQGGQERLRARLLPLVTCITPNTAELLLLAGSEWPVPVPGEFTSRTQVEEAAAHLARQFPGLSVVATGGHLASHEDLVVAPGEQPLWMEGEWVATTATHGTGCAYSSALLCHLVAGSSMSQSARAAREYVVAALKAATPMGHGGGSMHHLYALFPSYRVRRLS